MKPIASLERAAAGSRVCAYQWQARNVQGLIQRGELQAADRAQVKAQLRRQGLMPLQIQRKRGPSRWRQQNIPSRDLALFTRQLATMLKAGLPLIQALELGAAGLQVGQVRARLLHLRDAVSQGEAFSAALRKFPNDFDALYCNLVAAGEDSGTLEVLLQRLALHLERAQALKARVTKALRYPFIVLSVALAVTAVLLVKVVPAFAATFADLGAELPALTQHVMNLSTWTRTWWPALLGGMVATTLLIRSAVRRSPRCRALWERMLLRLPALGGVVRFAALARFCRTLATTFGAGLPLVDALTASAGATGNLTYETAILEARAELSTGVPLSHSLHRNALFPPLLVQLVGVGEESGTLEALLARCADIYEAEADTLTDNLTALLEPLIMAVLGILVGVLLLALYLPLFQFGSVL